jgi:galactokinase
VLLDCRSLEGRPVPLPEEAVLVVMDTGSRRGLAASAYNERRASCEKAVHALSTLRPGLRALRDVDEELLGAGGELLDPTTRARAAHVVGENARPLALAEAFARGDLQEAGRLMNDSHASLRDPRREPRTSSRAWAPSIESTAPICRARSSPAAPRRAHGFSPFRSSSR